MWELPIGQVPSGFKMQLVKPSPIYTHPHHVTIRQVANSTVYIYASM